MTTPEPNGSKFGAARERVRSVRALPEVLLETAEGAGNAGRDSLIVLSMAKFEEWFGDGSAAEEAPG